MNDATTTATTFEPGLMVLGGLEGNSPTHLKGMQLWLAPHADWIVIMWWVVWVCVLAIALYRLVRMFTRR